MFRLKNGTQDQRTTDRSPQAAWPRRSWVDAPLLIRHSAARRQKWTL